MRRLLLIALTLAPLLSLAPASEARSVPFGFFGTEFGQENLLSASRSVQSAQLTSMVQSGVESLRADFNWESIEPAPGRFNWAGTDGLVTLAANHGLDLLPTILRAPRWASTQPRRKDYYVWPPSNSPRPFTQFLTALVHRYGPKGRFWATHRSVPRHPIRAWQIWNEPGFRNFYGDPGYQQTYPRLLIAADNAIKAADPKATVVTAGLTNLSWIDLVAFYKARVNGHFDVLALHPFSQNLVHLTEIIRENQNVLRGNGQPRMPIWLTEMTFPASAGQIPRSDEIGLDVTPTQQSNYLYNLYQLLAHDHSYHVQRVFWFSWATSYLPPFTFAFSGLTKAVGQTFQSLPVLATYARVARTLEGCSKLSVATRCGR